MKSKTYEEFVEKFKPKKTADDCYTPPEVYEVIKDWVCRKYGIDPEKILRPFWPGGDYENAEYPEGFTVVDNPPFSILSKICTFYLEHEIPFFLFAPSLTALSSRANWNRINHVMCDCKIEYENGAIVKTSFITNMEPGIIARTEPELSKLVNAAVEGLRKEKTRQLPKYEYPDHIVTAAMMQRWAGYGVDFEVKEGDCILVSRLDAQKADKKTIFGCGLLLSDQAAAERAAAERAAAIKYGLSERERHVIYELSKRERHVVDELSRKNAAQKQ